MESGIDMNGGAETKVKSKCSMTFRYVRSRACANTSAERTVSQTEMACIPLLTWSVGQLPSGHSNHLLTHDKNIYVSTNPASKSFLGTSFWNPWQRISQKSFSTREGCGLCTTAFFHFGTKNSVLFHYDDLNDMEYSVKKLNFIYSRD